MALHEQSVGATSEWYTPPHVFKALGVDFDMDVASPGKQVTPWIPARQFLLAKSLEQRWGGFVWMNPPFGGRNGIEPWLDKFKAHGNGIALVPDRTSAPWWQRFAPHMSLWLFVSPKLKFIDSQGIPGESPAQGTCLMAAGLTGMSALYHAAKAGLGILGKPEK
jgi:hypothetical protein